MMDLDKVYGLTLKNNSALAVNSRNSLIAYPAGCTIVLLNQQNGQQMHVISESLKTITCLAFSKCGRYLVSGECGYMPSIRVWDLQLDSIIQVAEYQAHKYSVQCAMFSPNNKYIISIGCKYDMIVNVWDWRNSLKIASSKVSTVIKAIDISESGKHFITVGNRLVKFWYLQASNISKSKETIPLIGRSAILGEQRNNDFCGIVCGKMQSDEKSYAITKSGLLCEFNSKRLLSRWVDLKTNYANCVTSTKSLILVGCYEGIIRCFQADSLQYVTTLPRTHYLGVDISQGLSINHLRNHPKNAKYPSPVALKCDESRNVLTCVYDDHSLYVWNISNIKYVGKMYSLLYHSSCIWGIEMRPVSLMDDADYLPSDTFITYASDDTLRFWNFDEEKAHNFQKNVYSNELLKIIYIDKQLMFLKNIDLEKCDANESEPINNYNIYDSNNGLRYAKFSPDCKYLASGDRIGNIFVYDVSREVRELFKIEAHDSEVLSLDFLIVGQIRLLASGSRDRFLHIFDITKNFSLTQTISDHRSSITSLKFLTQSTELIRMITCSADRNLFIRKMNRVTANGIPYEFVLIQKIVGKSMFFDMAIDEEKQLIFTVCHDRNVHVFGLDNGKHLKKFKGCAKNDGICIKITMDRSNSYIAVSSTDKSIAIFSCRNGERITTLFGHSELVTGLSFTNDCQKLISVAGDGCIFVWKVPHAMVLTMRMKLNQNESQQTNIFYYQDNLPTWVQKDFQFQEIDDVEDDNLEVSVGTVSTKSSTMLSVKGKWAERVRNIGEDFHDFFNKNRSHSSEDDSAFGSMTVDSQQNVLGNNVMYLSGIKLQPLVDVIGNKYSDDKYEKMMRRITISKEKLQNINLFDSRTNSSN